MKRTFLHLNVDQLAAIHEKAADLYELIDADPHFPESLKCHLVALIIATEEDLNLADPLVDRQPVIVTEFAQVQ